MAGRRRPILVAPEQASPWMIPPQFSGADIQILTPQSGASYTDAAFVGAYLSQTRGVTFPAGAKECVLCASVSTIQYHWQGGSEQLARNVILIMPGGVVREHAVPTPLMSSASTFNHYVGVEPGYRYCQWVVENVWQDASWMAMSLAVWGFYLE